MPSQHTLDLRLREYECSLTRCAVVVVTNPVCLLRFRRRRRRTLDLSSRHQHTCASTKIEHDFRTFFLTPKIVCDFFSVLKIFLPAKQFQIVFPFDARICILSRRRRRPHAHTDANKTNFSARSHSHARAPAKFITKKLRKSCFSELDPQKRNFHARNHRTPRGQTHRQTPHKSNSLCTQN